MTREEKLAARRAHREAHKEERRARHQLSGERYQERRNSRRDQEGGGMAQDARKHGICLMHEYTKEEVIAWLKKIQNDDEFDYAMPYDALAQAAIEYIEATMPALEGDTA
jgi:hypothetical protein